MSPITNLGKVCLIEDEEEELYTTDVVVLYFKTHIYHFTLESDLMPLDSDESVEALITHLNLPHEDFTEIDFSDPDRSTQEVLDDMKLRAQ